MRTYLVFLVLLLLGGCPSDNTSGTSPSLPVTQPSQPSQPSRPIDTIAEKKALTSYLTTPFINAEVEKLAKVGVAQYNDNATGLKAARAGQPAKGGRKASWIKDTFLQDEPALIALLKKEDGPKTWTIETINDAYEEATKTTPRDVNAVKAEFVLVKGLSVNYLHDAPLGKDSILQLASQFNYLESPGNHKVSVSNYLGDSTQGPQGSIEAAAAALHRTAAEEAGKLPHALTGVLPSNNAQFYQNGYLELFKVPNADLKSLRDHIAAHLSTLAILPQWVINEPSGVLQLQVFSAAPSYQGKAAPAKGSLGAEICSLLVAPQYEAIAKLAVIRSILTNKPIAVHFTLVGQGAFANPPEVMGDSFKRVANVVKGYDKVHVYVHGFDATAQGIVRNQVDANLVTLTEMDKNTFMAAAGF